MRWHIWYYSFFGHWFHRFFLLFFNAFSHFSIFFLSYTCWQNKVTPLSHISRCHLQFCDVSNNQTNNCCRISSSWKTIDFSLQLDFLFVKIVDSSSQHCRSKCDLFCTSAPNLIEKKKIHGRKTVWKKTEEEKWKRERDKNQRNKIEETTIIWFSFVFGGMKISLQFRNGVGFYLI